MSLFEPQPSFLEHDTFTHALLGLFIVNKKFETLLNLSSIEPVKAPNPSEQAANDSNDNDEFLLAALGLVALHIKLRSTLHKWADGELTPETDSFSGTFGFEALDDLLR